MTVPTVRPYEFDDTQNSTFKTLSSAMSFVAVAMMLLGVTVGLAALVAARTSLVGAAILAPGGLAVGLMGVQLWAAGRRFRRIAVTRGNDIGNLIQALEQLAIAYRIQRWLWLTLSAVIVFALSFTVVAR